MEKKRGAGRKDATVASSFCSFWRGIDGGAAVDWREEEEQQGSNDGCAPCYSQGDAAA